MPRKIKGSNWESEIIKEDQDGVYVQIGGVDYFVSNETVIQGDITMTWLTKKMLLRVEK